MEKPINDRDRESVKGGCKFVHPGVTRYPITCRINPQFIRMLASFRDNDTAGRQVTTLPIIMMLLIFGYLHAPYDRNDWFQPLFYEVKFFFWFFFFFVFFSFLFRWKEKNNVRLEMDGFNFLYDFYKIFIILFW